MRPLHTARLIENVAGVQKALAEWDNIFSARVKLGGEEALTRPLVEDEYLYAAANTKATAVRSAPLRIYASDAPEADDEVGPDDPLVRLLTVKPNVAMTAGEVWYRSVLDRISCGEHFWALADAKGDPVARAANGLIATPTQIIPMSGRSVDGYDDDPRSGLPTHWRWSAAKGNAQRWDAHAFLPFVDADPYKMFRGVGVAQVLERLLGVKFQVNRYLHALAANGGEPGGVISVPTQTAAEEIRRSQAEIDGFQSNPDNRGRYMVLGGEATFTPNTLAPKDMEFGELLRWVREAALGLVGVPGPCVGIFEDANYSMYVEATRAMWVGPNGVQTYLSSVEAVLNERFFPMLADPRYRNFRAYFDVSNVSALQVEQTGKIEAAARTSTLVSIPFNASLALHGVDAKVDGGDEVPESDMPMDASDAPEGVEGATPGDPNTDAVVGDGVQGQLLNGAQMQAAIDIVVQVTEGLIPRDSAVALLQTLLGLSPEQANDILGSAEPREPAPEPDQAPAEPDAAKSLTRGAPDLSTREARVKYWQAVEKRVHEPGETLVFRAARTFLKRYSEAQLARVRAFARDATKGFDGWERKALTEEEVRRQVDVLLLNKKEWEEKMAVLFDAPIERVTSLALTQAAEEVGSISIGVGDPRIASAMATQQVKLVEGVTSTLAERVRGALVEELTKASSIADLQAAVRERLPELEESLRGVFANRDARAQVIARTEAGQAAKSARVEQFKADGIAKLRWITQGDGAVRESHIALDGDVAPIGGRFKNGLAYPQDPNGPADEVIQCRCTTAPVYEDEL